MTFTKTIPDNDGHPLIVCHGATQEAADKIAIYTSLCVSKFAGMPKEAIESMPDAGVPGLALEYGRYVDMEDAFKRAAKDDDKWADPRQIMLMGVVEKPPSVH